MSHSFALGVGSIGSRGFLPTMIAGIQMRLIAGVGVTVDGSTNVQTWADQSGNGNNASQGTAANRPAFISSNAAVGGRSTVRFLGAGSKWLTHSLGAMASNFTVWAMVCSDTGSGATNFQVLYGNNGGAFLLSNGTGTGGDWGCYLNGYIDSTKGILDGNGHSLGWSCPTVGGTQTFCTDGVVTTVAGGTAYTGATGQIGNGGGSIQGAACDLAELIVWNTALSSTQLQQLDRYARATYGAG